MIAWMFASLYHAVLGLVLLVGALGLAVFTLGRALANGSFTDHDVHRCGCPTCQGKRLRAWKRHQNNKPKPRVPVEERTLKRGRRTTEELRTADRILAKGTTYEVVNLIGDMHGVQVYLNNMGTGKRSMVFVRIARMNVRLWQVID